MFDITKIKEFSAQYMDMSDNTVDVYVQVEGSLHIDEKSESVIVTLQDKDTPRELFHIRITKEGAYYVLSADEFDDNSTPNRLNIFEGENEFILLHRYPNTMMYIHAHYE